MSMITATPSTNPPPREKKVHSVRSIETKEEGFWYFVCTTCRKTWKSDPPPGERCVGYQPI